MNILNVALTARAFLFFGVPATSGEIWIPTWRWRHARRRLHRRDGLSHLAGTVGTAASEASATMTMFVEGGCSPSATAWA